MSLVKNLKVNKRPLYKLILIVVLCLIAYKGISEYKIAKKEQLEKAVYLQVKSDISEKFLDQIEWPKSIEVMDHTYKLEYTFDQEFTNHVKKLLKRYRSDYASVVVIDNNTSDILVALDYSKDIGEFGRAITFSSTSPAASLFKVVTAAELLENTEVENDTVFNYRGRSTTLYKYQLKKDPRHTRRIPFNKAFAYSNNVVFGKAAIQNTTANSLFKMAEKFGFNENILQELSLGTSRFPMAENQYNLAELASGFNRVTLISPIHAATMASIVGRGGLFSYPQVLKTITDSETGQLVWKNRFDKKRVLSDSAASELRSMMELTTERGTARAVTRRLSRNIKNNLIIGGKTGTITGGIPHGKRDWFISYAMPSDRSDSGVSIAVMIVNVKKWYVKSTFLTRKIIEYYYKNIVTKGKQNG